MVGKAGWEQISPTEAPDSISERGDQISEGRRRNVPWITCRVGRARGGAERPRGAGTGPGERATPSVSQPEPHGSLELGAVRATCTVEPVV